MYISATTAAGGFFSYQWDGLFCEALVASVFMVPMWQPHAFAPAPFGGCEMSGPYPRPAFSAVATLWWLAFRLHFFGGFVCKWTSGCKLWHGLTAFHHGYIPYIPVSL